MPSSKPVAPGLIRMKDSEAALLGGRRLSDGKIVFPMPSGPEALLHKEIEHSPRHFITLKANTVVVVVNRIDFIGRDGEI